MNEKCKLALLPDYNNCAAVEGCQVADGDGMKHIVAAIVAALIAAAITICLQYYGAHDIQGFFAAVAGYPGLLANGENAPLNAALFTGVNWLFYFLLVEGAIALKKKVSSPSEP